MYAVFTSKAEAEAFGVEVDRALGYPLAGEPAQEFPVGWTLRHADPIEHPDPDRVGGRFAYPLDGVPRELYADDVAHASKVIVLDALDPTWRSFMVIPE